MQTAKKEFQQRRQSKPARQAHAASATPAQLAQNQPGAFHVAVLSAEAARPKLTTFAMRDKLKTGRGLAVKKKIMNDSGTTHHIFQAEEDFIELYPTHDFIKTADGAMQQASGVGVAKLTVHTTNGEAITLLLPNAYYFPVDNTPSLISTTTTA